jgi:hypothetical protein
MARLTRAAYDRHNSMSESGDFGFGGWLNSTIISLSVGCIMSFASWLGSRGRVLERLGMSYQIGILRRASSVLCGWCG